MATPPSSTARRVASRSSRCSSARPRSAASGRRARAPRPRRRASASPGRRFCLCGNGDEGEQTCREDGQSYEPCAPCYEGPGPVDDEDVYRPPDRAGRVSDGPRDGAAATCGNGTVERGEACDDGNEASGDGCSATCQPDGDPVAGTACPGRELHLWDESPVVVDTKTANPSPNTLRASPGCGGSTGSTGAERVFKIVPHAKGKVRVATSAATFPHLVYAGAACVAPVTTVACANASPTNGNETLEAAVEADAPLTVVVDGSSAATGTLKVTFSLLAP